MEWENLRALGEGVCENNWNSLYAILKELIKW